MRRLFRLILLQDLPYAFPQIEFPPAIARDKSAKPTLQRSDWTMSHAALLSQSGLFIAFAGGALAYKGDRYFENLDTVEQVAGFLLIAGLACIGTSLGLILGASFP
jgi:hypothetical protein